MGDTHHEHYVIGVEIGGTKLQAALGRSTGQIIHLEASIVPPGSGAETILSWFETAIPLLIQRAGTVPVLGIGIGFGGPVNSAEGAVITSHQVEGWSGFPLASWFEDRFGVPVRLENDSNAAGWAEYRLGAGRGTQTFCYMNIGSGIGGALVLDGKLHNGQGLGAFELGHTYIPDVFTAEPGRPVKLEDRFSGWSIENRLRSDSSIPGTSALRDLCTGNQERLDCAMLGEAARGGDAYAIQTVETIAGYIGVALANAIALLHPEVVALGGGVSLMGEVLLNPLRAHVEDRMFAPYRDSVRIEPAVLTEDVVVAGALLLAPVSGEGSVSSLH
jgi:glucokinase